MATLPKDKEYIEAERVTPSIMSRDSWRPIMLGTGTMPEAKKKRKTQVRIADARLLLEEMIRSELPTILQGQIELAKGVHMARKIVEDEITGEVREVEIYRQKPSIEAAKFLIDQLVGKAKERVEVQATLRTLVDVVNDLEAQSDMKLLEEHNRN